MYYHEALVKLKPCIAFTLKLSQSVIEAAYQSGNVTSYLREQIRRQLKYRFPKNPFQDNISFVFAIEAHHYPKKPNKPRIEHIDPHLHGVISIPNSDNWEEELRSALKAAGGKGVRSQLHFCMKDTLSDGSYINWCCSYATKLLDHNKDLITGKSIASTQDLIKIGKALYEHDKKQVSDYIVSIKSGDIIPLNKQPETPSSISTPKEEVLDKSQKPDPDAFTEPTSSLSPYTADNLIKDESKQEPAQIYPFSSRRYTLEETMEILSELDNF